VALSKISTEEYTLLRTFLEEASGIVLGDNKEYLVISRLKKLEISDDIKNFSDLLKAANQSKELRERIVDAMTTNETSWYRDKKIYDCFDKTILPDLIKTRPNKIRIWSAACSTGQEPYSISMSISSYMKRIAMNDKDYEIVGTDISNEVLDKAKAGRYDEMVTARGLPDSIKKEYFIERGLYWDIAGRIKSHVRFESINLKNNFSSMGKFDVIFCRNVLIYFSSELKNDVIARLAAQITPGGYFILGGSETMTNYADWFEMHKSDTVVYYKLKP